MRSNPTPQSYATRGVAVRDFAPIPARALPLAASPRWVLVYLGAHVVLAMLAQRFWPVSTLWALALAVVGFASLTRRRAAQQLTLAIAYVVGAELIWRGSDARVFWEYGKYLLIVLMILALLQRSRQSLEWRAALFVGCMLPSLVVLPYFDRREVAFNLSGPVALGVAMLFFSGINIDRVLLLRLAALALGPITGLASLAAIGTLKAEPEAFAVGAKTTTAGIGPNQVSSVLGLGVFLVVVLLLIGPRRRGFRFLLGGLGIWLVIQTILSFSRGGLWTAAGSVLIVAWFIVRDRRRRGALVAVALLGFVVLRFVVVPLSDQISGGIASARMVDTGLTGRDKIMKADLIIFVNNPIFGVGPGQSYDAHAITYRPSSAHTEYTRLLAEHGSFGILAMVMVAWLAWTRWRREEPTLDKAIGLGCMAWALLYMGHSAMRLSAPALMFGLGVAFLMLDNRQGRPMNGSPPGSVFVRWQKRASVP